MQDDQQTTAHAPHLRNLLTEREAAGYLGLENHQTLAVWRCNKRYAIPYIKIGRNVRYSLGDLQKWLDARTVHSSALEVL